VLQISRYTTGNAFGVALLSSAVHRTIPAARSADAACGGAITEKRIFFGAASP